jgi:hypothetical protein
MTNYSHSADQELPGFYGIQRFITMLTKFKQAEGN